MVLVRQVKLYFQDGKSDKVYEVDLCEVGENQFVVNFRYGKRDANLKEGTKTVFPVEHEKAIKVFDKLVESKVKKGYVEATANSAPKTKPEPSVDHSESKGKILFHLKNAAQGKHTGGNWKLSRIMWRAGELKLTEAAASIHQIVAQGLTKDELYSAIWSLGRIPHPESLSIVRDNITEEKNNPLQRLIRTILNKEKDATAIQKEMDDLPADIRDFLIDRNFTGLSGSVEAHCSVSTSDKSFLLGLYLLSMNDVQLHDFMFAFIDKLPLVPNMFQHIRYVHKASEVLDDASIWAKTSLMMVRSRSFYTASYWGVYIGRDWISPEEEMKKEKPRIAFSSRTRAYFGRRALRKLERAGNDKQEEYCALASELLIQLTESDSKNHKPYERWIQEGNRWTCQELHYHKLTHILQLYPILFGNSNRFLRNSSKKWVYLEVGTTSDEREEGFPELWDKYPEYLARVLKECQNSFVLQFAVKAFRDRNDKAEWIDKDLVLKLLSVDDTAVNELGLELVVLSHDKNHPDFELILMLINHEFKAAEELAVRLLGEHPTPFIENLEFIKQILLVGKESTANWLKNRLLTNSYSESSKESIVQFVLNQLTNPNHEANILTIFETLQLLFPEPLKLTDVTIIQQFIASEVPTLNLIGARLLLNHKLSIEQFPLDLTLALLESTNSDVRITGIEILGKLPSELLLSQEELLVGMCTSEHEDIRQQIQPVLIGLLERDPSLKQRLVAVLLPILHEEENYEGLHKDVMTLISKMLDGDIDLIKNETLPLLRTPFSDAHKLGYELLVKTQDLNQWTINDIVWLSSHEMRNVRRQCFNYFENNVARVIYEKEDALKILEKDWKESRDFGFQFFEQNFTEKEWTVDLLIGVCDSIRDDVQNFGKRLITKYFKSENGDTYLLKLSQHPNQNLQLYTTNYLREYASGDLEKLKALEHYFKVVLWQVNKGRTAKDRVFQFLVEQSKINIEFGQFVVSIFNKTVLTAAIQDKAKFILALNQLNKQYPDIENALEVQPLEKR